MGLVEIDKCEETPLVEESTVDIDKESRDFRRYLAQQEALREFERLKANAFATTYMISFIR
jgi:hypothetical protein